MNRIYQGRVNKVQILKEGAKGKSPEDWQDLDNDPKEARRLDEELLWNHHQLFQDAVNYYIVALAALGFSPESKLTKLQQLLGGVWEVADKKGQIRKGMRESLQRAWQMAEPPTLEAAIQKFRESLTKDGIPVSTAEKAGEFLLHKLGGDSAIQQGGRDFLPMFCDVESTATFKLSATRLGRADDEARLQKELHSDLDQLQIENLASSVGLGSVVNLQPNGEVDSGDAVVARLREAFTTFDKLIKQDVFEGWIKGLKSEFTLPKRRGGNINVRRVNACSLFLAFPNQVTKELFQATFKAPVVPKVERSNNDNKDKELTDESFIVDGDDPIKLSRGTRGCVFVGFTALPLWKGDGRKLGWKEFDIAAFKEALKVYNQFQQNVEKREAKLNGFVTSLLVMDGEQAMVGYTADADKHLRDRLEKVWKEAKGKPRLSANDSGEDATRISFTGDARIDRLRKIINDDLAEEYRLTDGRRTAYGLRRRTMKGWGEVKRKWQGIVKKGEAFSEDKRRVLKSALDEMRGGEKREQIGSHKLFEALIGDEAAWSIWREPDDKLQEQIVKNEWAPDPLEAFREYCEIREAMEEVAGRPLNFTPADSRFSRRLFMFTDACSFGKDGGEYKHDLREQAVMVPVAICGPDGRFAAQTCRLTYSAPRLLRDQIRGEDGSYAQDWTQPMMQALFGKVEGKVNPQKLKDAAVQLMPDYDGQGKRRVLLNFPLNLDDAKIKDQVGKANIWQKQFVTWKKGNQLPFLRWSADFDGKEPHRWWERVASFRVLAADLGTRHAASIALVEYGQQGGGTARWIGRAGEKEWFGRFCSGAILRLPGENAVVLRPRNLLDKDNRGKAFREELFGEWGRVADDVECEETLAMLTTLGPLEKPRKPDEQPLPHQGLLRGITDIKELQKQFSLPELNDKLLVAMRRAQGWIATCISWHWKLTQPDNEEQRQAALAALREQERVPDWQPLADGDAENLVKLRDALHVHINNQRQRVQDHLLQLTRRILPLRGRQWEWTTHPEKPDCHLLRQTAEGIGPKTVKLRGQRGLSMARIEQLSELRRRWQSLNQSMRRQIGEKPLTASEMRNDPIPDPCPDLLTKLENIREQRVNQTAHLILAQALGLKLREPQKSAQTRASTDTHGEYKVARPPVDFIVLEDLSRYLSDQGRAKSENTRLIKWCHRAIMLKVKMLAEPFGIPVLETPAAYSSRFCSLTGIAGFRAAEVGWADRDEFRWRVLLSEAAKAKEEGKTPSENALHAVALFDKLEKISFSDHPHRKLIAPQPGGPMFVTAQEVANPAPAANRKQNDKSSVLPIQADLNAAANLAFRAVAHPDCTSIHHRLRTERKKGAKDKNDTFISREKRRFNGERIALLPKNGGDLPKEKNTNFFYDEHHVAKFGRAQLETDSGNDYRYAAGPGLWKTVNDCAVQWRRVNSINAARLHSWGIESPSGWESRKSQKRDFDPNDDISHDP